MVSTAIPFVILGLVLVPLVFSYDYSGYRWSGDSATYDSSYLPEDWRWAVDAAAVTWNSAGSKFRFNSGGGSNNITRGSVMFGPAYTNVVRSGDYITRCETVFDRYLDWSASGNPEWYEYDVQNVMTHEFGHWLELRDVYDPEATMYGYIDMGETKKRSLAQDDIDGIRHIYGTGDPGCSKSLALKRGIMQDEWAALTSFGGVISSQSQTGRHYVGMCYTYAPEILRIFESDPKLGSEFGRLIRALMPDMTAVVQEASDQPSRAARPLSREKIKRIEGFLQGLSKPASPQLKAEIEGFRRIVVDGAGKTLAGLFADEPAEEGLFWLSQGVPNPSNPGTTFRYRLAEPGQVEIVVFNVVGQKVRVLREAYQATGLYTITWDGRDQAGKPLSSGVYFLRMQVNDVMQSRKVLLAK